jgi:hypothetical protein
MLRGMRAVETLALENAKNDTIQGHYAKYPS